MHYLTVPEITEFYGVTNADITKARRRLKKRYGKDEYHADTVGAVFGNRGWYPTEEDVAEFRGELKSCLRCGDLMAVAGRAKICGGCRFDTDASTSQCPFCGGVYKTHGSTTPSEKEVMQFHAREKCQRG